MTTVTNAHGDTIDLLEAKGDVYHAAKALSTAAREIEALRKERDKFASIVDASTAQVRDLLEKAVTRGYATDPDGNPWPTDRATTPRTIPAEDLKVGQQIAWKNSYKDWHTTRVDESDITPDNIFTGRSIVLLEDASATEPEPLKVGDTVTTAEQLDAMPTGTVLLDRQGDSVQLFEDGWRYSNPAAYGSNHVESLQLANDCQSGPFKILHLPGADSDE